MPTRPPATPRTVTFLATVVLWLVAVLTLGSSAAVADTGTLAGTGVAASNLAQPESVWPITDISPGEGQETGVDSYDLVRRGGRGLRSPQPHPLNDQRVLVE